jgi:hypothetical protein
MRIRQRALRGQTNAPFLSGDGFASLTDYLAFGPDGSEKINLHSLRAAHSIFVKGELLERLLKENFSDISAQVLVSGNSDQNWDAAPPLPPTVEHWLCQNSSIADPRITTLPIGLENLSYARSGMKKHYNEHRGPQITHKVLVPPMSNTNSIRPITVAETLNRPDLFDTSMGYTSTRKYFSLAKKYRFVLCLEGNGYDTHRMWETLYLGNFPVVLQSPWQQSLGYLNLPILAVDTIEDISPQLLQSFLDANVDFSPTETPCLWLDHWKQIIQDR